MVACTPRGSNIFDKDSLIGLPRPMAAIYPGCLGIQVLYPVAAPLILHASWYKCIYIRQGVNNFRLDFDLQNRAMLFHLLPSPLPSSSFTCTMHCHLSCLYPLISSCLPPLQVSSLQKELQRQREVEGSLQTQLGLLRDTLSSKDRELEALRMARAHQERVVEEMRAQVEVKEEECREKVRTNE